MVIWRCLAPDKPKHRRQRERERYSVVSFLSCDLNHKPFFSPCFRTFKGRFPGSLLWLTAVHCILFSANRIGSPVDWSIECRRRECTCTCGTVCDSSHSFMKRFGVTVIEIDDGDTMLIVMTMRIKVHLRMLITKNITNILKKLINTLITKDNMLYYNYWLVLNMLVNFQVHWQL